MSKKFFPKITKVKLNPEQAVLSCECYSGIYETGWLGYKATGSKRAYTNADKDCDLGGAGIWVNSACTTGKNKAWARNTQKPYACLHVPIDSYNANTFEGSALGQTNS